MNGEKKKGPLAEVGPGDEDVPLAEGEMPKDIEEMVLEEVGSLQYKAVMKRLDELEKIFNARFDKLEKLLKGKKQ